MNFARLFAAPAMALAALLALVVMPASAVSGTNGRNVTFVGTPQASFEMMSGRRWIERSNSGGGSFNFVEQNRDDWSVYLFDQSRGVNLQLDLHRRQIFYSDRNNPNRRPLYQITRSSSAAKGWNVRTVSYQGGVFQMSGGRNWIESNRDGRHNFQEQNRDEWSVYLFDPSRGVNIQLDLHRKEIFYADRYNPSRRVLYRITGARVF